MFIKDDFRKRVLRSGEEVLKDIRKENCPELKKSREDGEQYLLF